MQRLDEHRRPLPATISLGDGDASGCTGFQVHLCLLYLFLCIGSSLILWRKTKKQIVIARSSAKTELRVLAYMMAEMTWLRWPLRDFRISLTTSRHVHFDNTCVISIAQDPRKHQLTKHIGIDCFYVWCAVHRL
jgi:hypothetical protein